MMMHPAAVKTLKDTVNRLTEGKIQARPEAVADWVKTKIKSTEGEGA
jgi:CO dehydrogenase/acetyl-CoA synthase delta subunit